MTIESVLAQTYTNWEMIIQDACSTDNSFEIACRYAEKYPRIKVFRNEKNSGAALTRNRAIKVSQGKYLAFLDSDDIWFPEKLAKQLDFMQKNNCDFIFSEYDQIGENNESLGIRVNVITHLTYLKMLMHCWPGCLTVMYDQEKLGKIYTPDIPKNNDHALFLRVLKVAENAQGMRESLALYRIRSRSISRNKWKMIQLDMLIEKRRDIAHKITAGIQDVEGIEAVYEPEDYYHSFHLYTVCVDEKKLGGSRDEFMRVLYEEEGVQGILHYQPTFHFTGLKRLGYDPDQCPKASEFFYKRELNIPMHPRLTEQNIEDTVAGIRNAAAKVRKRHNKF